MTPAESMSSWDELLIRAEALKDPMETAGEEFKRLFRLLIDGRSSSTIGIYLAALGQALWISSKNWSNSERKQTAERARAFLEVGLSIEPAQSPFWKSLGETRLCLGDYGPAVEAFTTYLEENPRNVYTRALLADCLLQMARYTSARAEAQAAIEMADPSRDDFPISIAERVLKELPGER